MLLSMSKEDLTPKQKIFADNYLLSGNATAAAIESGTPPTSATVYGAKTLALGKVAKYISHARKPKNLENDKLKTRLLSELEAMAFANIEDLTTLDDEGNRRVDFSNATREQLAAVTKITNKVRRIYNSKGEHIATEEQSGFNLSDKYRGIELLGRHLGMFRVEEQRVVVDVADRLLAGRQRYLKITSVTDLPSTEDEEPSE